MSVQTTSYRFNVKDGMELGQWESDDSLTEEALLASIKASRGFKHHRQFSDFVLTRQTYPTTNSRSLALVISEYFNLERGVAFPSQQTLAERHGVHRNTIISWVDDLRASGYWRIDQAIDGSLHYRMTKETLIVFGEWLRQGGNTATSKSEYFKPVPVVFNPAKQPRKASRPPSLPRSYGAVVKRKSPVLNLTDAPTLPGVVREAVNIIASTFAAVEKMTDVHAALLANRLVDFVSENPAASSDDITNEAHALAMARREFNAKKEQDSKPF